MPFAIMRNAHELRASIRLQARALENDDRDAFGDEWQRFRRGLAVHMAMEDRAMFARCSTRRAAARSPRPALPD